jgi:hypothetical protein
MQNGLSAECSRCLARARTDRSAKLLDRDVYASAHSCGDAARCSLMIPFDDVGTARSAHHARISLAALLSQDRPKSDTQVTGDFILQKARRRGGLFEARCASLIRHVCVATLSANTSETRGSNAMARLRAISATCAITAAFGRVTKAKPAGTGRSP